MPRKKTSPERIISLLRQIEVQMASGVTLPQGEAPVPKQLCLYPLAGHGGSRDCAAATTGSNSSRKD